MKNNPYFIKTSRINQFNQQQSTQKHFHKRRLRDKIYLKTNQPIFDIKPQSDSQKFLQLLVKTQVESNKKMDNTSNKLQNQLLQSSLFNIRKNLIKQKIKQRVKNQIKQLYKSYRQHQIQINTSKQKQQTYHYKYISPVNIKGISYLAQKENQNRKRSMSFQYKPSKIQNKKDEQSSRKRVWSSISKRKYIKAKPLSQSVVNVKKYIQHDKLQPWKQILQQQDTPYT